MRLREEDEMLGVVAASLMEGKQGVCPTDEEFALYLERKLNKGKKKALITHFVSCRDCLERFTIPIHSMEALKGPNFIGRLLDSLHRPFVVAPVAVLFFALLTVSINIYLKSQDASRDDSKEIYRSPNLVVLKQVELTPDLLTTIKRQDAGGLKSELIDKLPPTSQVSEILVEDDLKNLKEVKKGQKVVLLLYNNGILKVKLE